MTKKSVYKQFVDYHRRHLVTMEFDQSEGDGSTSRKEKVRFIHCPICKKDQNHVWSSLSLKHFGLSGYHTYVKCDECSLIYKQPQYLGPIEDEGSFYKNNYGGYNTRKDKRLVRGRQNTYSQEIKYLTNHKKSGNFFDIGCGNGRFSIELSDEWDKYGYDCSSYAIEQAKNEFGLKNYYAGTIFDGKYEDRFFDVIYSRSHLYYLPDPRSELREVRRILKDDGILVLSMIPNAGSICGNIFKHNLKVMHQSVNKTNQFFFSTDSLKKMLTQEGLEVIDTKYPYFGTGYNSPWDLVELIYKGTISLCLRLLGREPLVSPPFYGNYFSFYCRKARS